MKSLDNNRLLLEIDRSLRTLNQEIINPELPELTLDGLTPVLAMVARSRALYLKELLELSNIVKEGVPSPKQIAKLTNLRKSYEELAKASQALETAIERGYLDVALTR